MTRVSVGDVDVCTYTVKALKQQQPHRVIDASTDNRARPGCACPCGERSPERGVLISGHILGGLSFLMLNTVLCVNV